MDDALQLADEYIRYTRRHVFLTGKAGTGKTTFLKKIWETCPKRMVIVAPTGIAAINAGGVTLHSFFGLPFGPYHPGSDSLSHSGHHRLTREKVKLVKSLDLIIIDEISMVRADMLDAVDAILRRYRKSNVAFGGVQLLLVGDLQQLPPVVTENEQSIIQRYYKTPYFFSSHALMDTDIVGIELEKIYRQTDPDFIDLLNCVRDNIDTARAFKRLNQQLVADVHPKEYPGYITLCTHNRQADAINAQQLAALDSTPYISPAVIEGDFPEKSYPAPENLELKVGSQVMFLRNDMSPDKKYFNGKIGSIISIKEGEIEVLGQGEDEPIKVSPTKWENIEYSLDEEKAEVKQKIVGAFTQYPLRLAWGITIHKSQGLTFDKVILDAKAAFSHGQVYVGLSRCRTLDGIVLRSQLSGASHSVDPNILAFNKKIRAHGAAHRNNLFLEKWLFQQQILFECFNFEELDRRYNLLLSQLSRYKEQVQVFGADDFIHGKTIFYNDVCVVGRNFCRQLQGLFSKDILPAEDPVIIERVSKASDYFNTKLNKICVEQLEDFKIESDNKEIKKQLDKALNGFTEETMIKLAAVVSCEDFAPEKYLRAISNASVEFLARETKQKKKSEFTYSEKDVQHPELFSELKNWRTEKAKELGIPAFHILHQKTIVQIAVHLPESIKALQYVRGVGPVTVERYGQELVSLIQHYCKEHKITSHTLPMLALEEQAKQKQESQKNTRETTLALYEQGLTIEEIAKEREMTRQTIEGHLAHWVGVGTVSIDRLINEEKREQIAKTFQEVGFSPLKKVKEILGAEVSYGELNLVRAYLQNQ